LAVDEEDQEVSLDQRGRRSGSKRHLVILLQVPLPEYFASTGIEAEEVPDSAHRIHFAILNDRRRDRSDLLVRVESPVLVGDLVDVDPERLAGRFVKTVNPFLGLGLHHLGIGKVDAASSYDWTGKTPSDRGTPADLQAFRRVRFQ